MGYARQRCDSDWSPQQVLLSRVVQQIVHEGAHVADVYLAVLGEKADLDAVVFVGSRWLAVVKCQSVSAALHGKSYWAATAVT